MNCFRSPIFNATFEHFYVWAMFLYLFFDYFLWVIKVIDQLCKHLKIKCFTIPYKKDHTPQAAKPTLSKVEPPETPTRAGRGRKKVVASLITSNSPLIELITKDDFESPRRITRSASKKQQK